MREGASLDCVSETSDKEMAAFGEVRLHLLPLGVAAQTHTHTERQSLLAGILNCYSEGIQNSLLAPHMLAKSINISGHPMSVIPEA